jgi:arsenate reductase
MSGLPGTPSVLFLCNHNAGRSQMAMGFFRHLAGDRACVYSGGSEPAEAINPAAVAAMAEVGIDIAREHPQRWTDDIVQDADVIVTMGCGDACPYFPGKRYENWELADPAGLDVDQVRPIRDAIESRVRRLIAELRGEPQPAGEPTSGNIASRAADTYDQATSPNRNEACT